MRSAARHPLRVAAALLVLAVVAAALLLRPWDAATGPAHAVSQRYASRWTGHSSALQRCVEVEVRGTVSGTWRATLGGGTAWTGVRLRDPALVVTGTEATAAGCRPGRAAALRTEASQRWSGLGCRLSLLSSVPEPADQDASGPVASACPEDRTGRIDTTAGPARVVTMAVSGTPITVGDAVTADGALVLRDAVALVAHTAGGSDVFDRTVTVRLTR